MTVKAIVAIGKDRQMGMLGRLPWHNPEDLKHFKDTVLGKPIICGRKTYEGLPNSIKDNCEVLVISSTSQDHPTFPSVEEAIEYADSDEVWVCGGSSIYRHCLEENLIDELWLSHIDYSGYADVIFPEYREWAQGGSIEERSFETFRLEILKPSQSLSVIKYPDSNFPNVEPVFQGGLVWREASDVHPEDPEEGTVYLNTDSNQMNTFINGEWVVVADVDEPAAWGNTEWAGGPPNPTDRQVIDTIQNEIREQLEGLIGTTMGPATGPIARHAVHNAVQGFQERGLISDVNITSDFDEDSGIMNVDLQVRPNHSIEMFTINQIVQLS